MVEGTKQIYLSTEEFQGGHFKLGRSLHIEIIEENTDIFFSLSLIVFIMYLLYLYNKIIRNCTLQSIYIVFE